MTKNVNQCKVTYRNFQAAIINIFSSTIDQITTHAVKKRAKLKGK